VAQDPLPSQIQHDPQPPPLISDDDDEEWREVEEILQERTRRGRGRGGPLRSEVLVKWKRFLTPTWELRKDLEHTTALAEFERERT